MFAVAAGPDGSWLATGSADRTVRIWNPATAQERTVRTGHKRRVLAIAVAPDGSWLATGSHDGTVRIWDTATRQPQALMRVQDSIVACAWLGVRELATGGAVGLYLFDFLPSITSPSTSR